MGRRSQWGSRRDLIGVADAVFIVPKRGGHSAVSTEKEKVRIAAEEFCDERDRPIAAGEIEPYDAVAGHVSNSVDAGALDASPKQLAEGGRSRRIGQGLINEM